MATKKQKRAEVEAKRQRRKEEERLSGLKALHEDRKHREDKLRDQHREKHDKNHSKKIDKDCILCLDLLIAKRKQGVGGPSSE